MRITNNMMTNTMLLNIMRNKNTLTGLETQLSTGKKIQKPSEDPVVAIRALRLRANLKEIQQYRSNVADANSWMSVTEKSMGNVKDIIKRARELTVQISNGIYTDTDMQKIVAEMEQLRAQILQEGNTNYAGRYIYSGLKTDNPLTFTERTVLQYDITQHLTEADITQENRVVDGTPARTIEVNRIRLGYNDIDDITATTFAGLTINETNSVDPAANIPTAGTINFIADTGEFILNSADATTLKAAGFNESFTYTKGTFEKDIYKPEHYYDCVKKENPADNTTWVTYTKEPAEMNYQIGFQQTMVINSEGDDVITTDIVRDFEQFITAVRGFEKSDTEYGVLCQENLTKNASKMIGKLDKHLANTLDQMAVVGSKINRLDMTETRLSEDEINYTDLMSENEDADLAEVVVRLTSQESIYNASLQAAGSIIQNSLLDFIR